MNKHGILLISIMAVIIMTMPLSAAEQALLKPLPKTNTIDVTPSKPPVTAPGKPTPPAVHPSDEQVPVKPNQSAPIRIEENPRPEPDSSSEPFQESPRGKKTGMTARIKDITHLRGVCDNQLIGYGIVGGLNGTGDRKGLCENGIATAIKNLGNNTVPTSDFKPKNMAAVMVTATLPAFAKSGDPIDVTVSSIGDANSIEGGMLLMTSLRAANGQVYATAQGPLSIGGMNFAGMRKNDSKNYPLVARVPSGGLVCRDMTTELTRGQQIYLLLNEPDFNTASTVAAAINAKFPTSGAEAIDAQTIRINNIYSSPADAVLFIAGVNNIEVTPETVARVVINERTGTVVVGSDVKIMPVAISHGCIDISIGQNKIEKDLKLSKKSKVFYLGTGASVKTLVEMLNYIGAAPRDIIAIFQALKQANALPAELIIL